MQEKLATYFATIAGTSDWATLQPVFDDLFHDDCVFVTADGEFTKAEWAEMARRLLGQGVSPSNFEVTEQDEDTLVYKVSLKIGDNEPLHLTQRGTVSGGQLTRIEPIDPSAFSKLVDRGGDE